MSKTPQSTKIQPYERLAAYYDQLMDYIDYEIWVEDIMASVEPHKLGNNWIDISCGTASMACLLAKQGKDMTAVDLSPHMVQVAKEKASDKKLNIEFHVGDMTNFRSPEHYDVLLNLHDGLNYLLEPADIQLFMDNSHSLLKPDGLLLFDVVTPLLCQTHFRGYREIFADEYGGYERHTSYDPVSQLAESTFTLKTEDEDRVELESHIQRAYDLASVQAFCEQSPFNWYQILDDETFEPATEESERLWVMLRNVS